jgi:hypothetical protein
MKNIENLFVAVGIVVAIAVGTYVSLPYEISESGNDASCFYTGYYTIPCSSPCASNTFYWAEDYAPPGSAGSLKADGSPVNFPENCSGEPNCPRYPTYVLISCG